LEHIQGDCVCKLHSWKAAFLDSNIEVLLLGECICKLQFQKATFLDIKFEVLLLPYCANRSPVWKGIIQTVTTVCVHEKYVASSLATVLMLFPLRDVAIGRPKGFDSHPYIPP